MVDRETRLERDWQSMIGISHDFFHIWRKLIEDTYGGEVAGKLVLEFWRRVGAETAARYKAAGRLDLKNLEHIVKAAARSSEMMGETVEVVQDGNDMLLIHHGCPWVKSYETYGAPGQCREGCTAWFEATLEHAAPWFTVESAFDWTDEHKRCIRRFKAKQGG